jgi:hypothetical protein
MIITLIVLILLLILVILVIMVFYVSSPQLLHGHIGVTGYSGCSSCSSCSSCGSCGTETRAGITNVSFTASAILEHIDLGGRPNSFSITFDTSSFTSSGSNALQIRLQNKSQNMSSASALNIGVYKTFLYIQNTIGIPTESIVYPQLNGNNGNTIVHVDVIKSFTGKYYLKINSLKIPWPNNLDGLELYIRGSLVGSNKITISWNTSLCSQLDECKHNITQGIFNYHYNKMYINNALKHVEEMMYNKYNK